MKTRIATLIAAALLAGCGGLAQETRPTVWLALEPALPQGAMRAGGPTVEVRRFAAAPPFDTDRVVTREGQSRWGFAVYHRWAVPPGEMVAARLRDALGRLDLFGAVFTPPAPLDADYRLSGAVRGLWWDRSAKSAVIEIEAALTARAGRLQGFWVKRAAVPVPGENVEDFLPAASAALSQAIAGLGTEIAGALAGNAAGTRPAMTAPESMPVTYAGEIPWADCAAQRLSLTLFADSTFRLRRTCVGAAGGGDAVLYDRGRWALTSDDDGRLQLTGVAEASRQFRIVAPDRIRMLDNQGREIRTPLNYDLVRQPGIDPVAGPMRLRGMYTYMADAATFTECLTGRRYPVPIEGDHAAVERAYAAARSEPGAPVLVTIDGRFVEREPEPGLPVREHLVIEKLDRFWPGATCARQAEARGME
jgi:uncharacterized lipoprotein NlpE involved in copper resistance